MNYLVAKFFIAIAVLIGLLVVKIIKIIDRKSAIRRGPTSNKSTNKIIYDLIHRK